MLTEIIVCFYLFVLPKYLLITCSVQRTSMNCLSLLGVRRLFVRPHTFSIFYEIILWTGTKIAHNMKIKMCDTIANMRQVFILWVSLKTKFHTNCCMLAFTWKRQQKERKGKSNRTPKQDLHQSFLLRTLLAFNRIYYP